MQIQPLCRTQATLTVSDGTRTHSSTAVVEVVPRSWKRPVRHTSERKWETVGLDRLLLPLGRNICALEPAGVDETGHFIHPGQYAKQYELARVNDPGGPFDGAWYVSAWRGRVERASLINRGFYPGSPVYDVNMEQNRDQFELLAESVRSHEKIHTQLLAATWAKADPGVRLDAIVADSENEALGAAVTIISETDERLRAATRDAAVKAKMRKLYGSASAHILLLDSSGAWTPLLLGPVADLGDEERPG